MKTLNKYITEGFASNYGVGNNILSIKDIEDIFLSDKGLLSYTYRGTNKNLVDRAEINFEQITPKYSTNIGSGELYKVKFTKTPKYKGSYKMIYLSSLKAHLNNLKYAGIEFLNSDGDVFYIDSKYTEDDSLEVIKEMSSITHYRVSKDCSGLMGVFESLPITYIEVPEFSKHKKISSCQGMFESCGDLIKVDMPKTYGQIRSLHGMFKDCFKLKTISLPEKYNGCNMMEMFVNCHSLDTICISDSYINDKYISQRPLSKIFFGSKINNLRIPLKLLILSTNTSSLGIFSNNTSIYNLYLYNGDMKNIPEKYINLPNNLHIKINI